jgi:acyl-coenzyme A synthetase/AMP-(fatty) acid ligase
MNSIILSLIECLGFCSIGWPVATNSLCYGPFPIKPGSSARPAPGWDIQVLDQDGKRLPPNHMGEIVIKLPVLSLLIKFFSVEFRLILVSPNH